MNSALRGVGLTALITATALANPARATDYLDGEPNLQPTTSLFMVYVNAADGADLSLDTHIASHAARERRGDRLALFDGETTRVSLSASRSMGERWRLDISARYFWINKGVLDPFIDSWHKAFGLPEGIRDDRPRDVLDFQVSDNGSDIIQLGARQRGIGDTRLRAHYRWREADAEHGEITLTTAIKLPTGDAARLTGSGGVDVGFGLNYRSAAHPDNRWRWSVGGSMTWLGDSDIVGLAERRAAASAQISADYRVTSALSLGARLQAHSAVIDSTLNNIGAPAAQLITGGEWRFHERWALRVTVAEDVIVEHSPDVTFRIGIAQRY
ncbi:MAG: DUF3187 family protein [Pseudomonadota bacterium]